MSAHMLSIDVKAEAPPAGMERVEAKVAEVVASGWGRVEVIVQDHRIHLIQSTTSEKV